VRRRLLGYTVSTCYRRATGAVVACLEGGRIQTKIRKWREQDSVLSTSGQLTRSTSAQPFTDRINHEGALASNASRFHFLSHTPYHSVELTSDAIHSFLALTVFLGHCTGAYNNRCPVCSFASGSKPWICLRRSAFTDFS